MACPPTFSVVLVAADRSIVEPNEFLRQTAAAAASLPGADAIINLCEDRRNFLMVFAAALTCRRTVLLPPSRTQAAVAELRARYPGSEIVDDSFEAAAGEPGLPSWEKAGGDFIAAIGHTSGSTGTPAAHAKSFRCIATSTALNAELLRAELARRGKSGRPWIVATVPPQHMYGLETSVLLPLLAGFGVHSAKPLLPADVAAALGEVPAPRILVSTPVHLRTLVESDIAFPEVSLVVSATAPLDCALANRIEARLGSLLVEFFGSTETCVIATRRPAHEEGWRPYPGVELAVVAGGTRVRAPWFAADQLLHDVMEIRPDRSFTVVGRGTDVIEVAGKRASLNDLARQLLSIGGVEDAVVFQPPVAASGTAGRCAALVIAPGLSGREIARQMRLRVDAVLVPRPIVVVPALPRNEVGKLPRERLIEALATASASRPRRGT